MDGILNVYVWEIASEALRGKSPTARQDLLHFTEGWDPALHCFHQKKNTLGRYIKDAVTLQLLTEHEGNQTISIYFPLPSFFPPFHAHRQKTLPSDRARKKQMNPAPTKAVW